MTKVVNVLKSYIDRVLIMKIVVYVAVFRFKLAFQSRLVLGFQIINFSKKIAKVEVTELSS